jgi:hypothetical protein
VRRASILALLLAVGVAAAHLPVLPLPAACAKDDKDKEKERERERIKREKWLKKIADAFGAKDSASLVGYVPPGQKVTLALGKEPAEYARDQARGVLDAYFADIDTLSVDTTDGKDGYVVNGTVGRFPVTYRKKGEDKKQKAVLHVTLGPLDANGQYTLAKLSIV